MPAVALTTTAKQLALRKPGRKSITFTGDLVAASIAIYYLRSSALKNSTVSSTDFDYAVGAGQVIVISLATDPKEIVEGAWYAISDTVTKVIGVADG